MNISYLADNVDVIPEISDWFYREWAYLYPNRTKIDVANTISERTNKNRIPLALVAFEGNELVGTVCLKVNDMDTKPELTPWMAGLYVKDTWRKKGVGSLLVRAIEEKASELEEECLYLYTPESEKFYAKLGWQVMEKVIYHNIPVTVMKKEIVL